MLETTENQNLQIGEFFLSESHNGSKSLEYEESSWKDSGKPSVNVQNSNDLDENIKAEDECEKNTIYHRFKTSPMVENSEKVLFYWRMAEPSDNFSTNDNHVNFR